MYQNSSDPGAAVKWVVIFLLAIIVGTAMAVFVLGGNFGPRETALANGINTQNILEQKRGEIDLKYYDPMKQAEIQAQIDKLAEDNRYLRDLHDQQLAQAERKFQQDATLGDWAVRGLVIGVIVALVIVGVAGAWAIISNAAFKRQIAAQTAIDNSRHGLLSKVVGDLKVSLEAEQKTRNADEQRLDEFANRLEQTRVEFSGTQSEFVHNQEAYAYAQEQIATQLNQTLTELRIMREDLSRALVQPTTTNQLPQESLQGDDGSHPTGNVISLKEHGRKRTTTVLGSSNKL